MGSTSPVNEALIPHDLIERGLPMASVKKLELATGLDPVLMAAVIHTSVRTYQRWHKDKVREPLAPVHGSGVWQLAEIWTRAVDVMGNEELARQWLNTSALALGGRKPVELMTTTQGAEMVNDLLNRLDYGVYT